MTYEKNAISQIRKRDGRISDFDQKKITEAILKAVEAVGEKEKLELVEKLSDETVKILNKKFHHRSIPAVEEVQDIVEEALITNKWIKVAKAYILYRDQHAKLRDLESIINSDEIVDGYLKQLDWRVKENSNMAYSLQGLNNHISSAVSARYWLYKVYPNEIRKAHSGGSLHLHDLSILAPYCCGWELKELLLQGFGGVMGKIESKPPKHLRTALGQIVNFFYTLQGEVAGAQAFANFDTYLAPFIRYDNLDYNGVKQCIQEFLFNVNVPTRVGFQSPFTNITMDIKPSKMVGEETVIIGGKPQREKYKDFQKEMDMINSAFCDVMMEGDAKGRVFTFPIPTYNITKNLDWQSPVMNKVFEMTSKYGIPYFCLEENTEIITDNGIKKIKDISLKDRLLSEQGKFIPVSFKKKTKFAESIHLKGANFNIICSKNHRFPTQNGLKKAEELSINDKFIRHNEYITLENGLILNHWSAQFFDLPPLSEIPKQKFVILKTNNKLKKLDAFKFIKNRFQTTLNENINIPKDLDEDLMELIGIILGDGSLKRDSLRIINADKEILSFAEKTITEKFGVKSSIRPAGKSKICKELSFNSVIMQKFLSTIGLSGNTYSKRIPEICFWRKDNEIGALLRGLFDTDGSIGLNRRKDHIISITLANKPLIDEILILLAKIGIIGNLDKRARISITGERNIEIFKKKIGFRIKRKKELLSHPPKISKKPSIGDMILSSKEASSISSHYKYAGKELVRVKQDYSNPYLYIKNHKKETTYENLISIEHKKEDVIMYDVSVESKKHLFTLKNGILSHNSNFINSDMDPDDARSMCCRLRLDNNELRKRGGGLFAANPLTGSVGVVTVNLPRLGYISKNKNTDKAKSAFFKNLEDIMLIAKESLEIKRKILETLTDNGLYPYARHYLSGIKSQFGTYWKNHFSTIGTLGMNEALVNIMGKNIAEQEGKKFALEIMDFMLKKVGEFQEKTNNLYNLESVPGEGASYRMAKIDKKKYPDIIVANEKNAKEKDFSPYYTNSTHLPVNYTDDIFEALKLQDELQTKYTGGTVLHGYIGERMPSKEATKKLVKKIAENFHLPYFTITPTFSVCPKHGYIAGEHFYCPICDEENKNPN